MHYKKIDKSFPVFIGKEFWSRLTGWENIYPNLVLALHENINSLETKNVLNEGCKILEKEISSSNLFDFKLKS